MIEERRPELRAKGFTDEQTDAEIARMRLEAQLGVRLSSEKKTKELSPQDHKDFRTVTYWMGDNRPADGIFSFYELGQRCSDETGLPLETVKRAMEWIRDFGAN